MRLPYSNFRMFADFRKLAALIFSLVFLFFTGFAHNGRAAGYDFNKNLFFGGQIRYNVF